MAKSSYEGLTIHLRASSQEVFDGHEGLFAAKAKSGEPFLLRLSTDPNIKILSWKGVVVPFYA